MLAAATDFLPCFQTLICGGLMRYSKEHKGETHARIVQKASVRIREKGVHGVGVAALMQEAGLTHGGFYKHFSSREDLLIEAVSYAMDRSMVRWRKNAEEAPPDQRLPDIIKTYLAPAHCEDPGTGCAIAALGAEIARESDRTREVFAEKLDEMIGVLADQFPDPALMQDEASRRRKAMMILSVMTGALLLARAAGGGSFSAEILEAGQEAALAGMSDPKPVAKSRGKAKG